MSYIIKRIGQSVFTLFAVISVSFALIRLMPGGPADALAARLFNEGYSSQEINRLVDLYLQVNPREPLLQSYLDYMTSILQGDFGRSIQTNEPVIEILLQAMPWTIFYASVSLLISFMLGVILGALMAYNEGSTFDVSATISAIVINSTPYYVIAIISIAFFGYNLGWFPTGGKIPIGVEVGFTPEFLLGALHHAALPILSSIFIGFGGFAIGMRGNSISVLGEDYVRVADLRGLSQNRIALRYVGRNAILPLYTRLMLSLGGVFGGSVILEEIFRYQGVGYYVFQAVSSRDLPLMMGGFILISVAIIIGVLIADLTYHLIDPRASTLQQNDNNLFDDLRVSFAKLRFRINQSLDGESMTESHSVKEDPFSAETGDSSAKEGFYSTSSGDSLGRETTDPEKQEEGSQSELLNSNVFAEYVRAPLVIIWEDWRSRVGIGIVLLYLFVGLVAWISASDWWFLQDVVLVSTTELQAEPRTIKPFQTLEYPLGTDPLGQDLFSLMVYATPAMLKMLLSGAIFTTVLATIIGTVAGFKNGTSIDRLLVTFVDVAITIPALPLIMVLAITVGPRSPLVVGVLLSITAWAGLARTLRSQVISTREASYVEISELMNISTPVIILKEIIPNLMPYILVSFVGAGRRVIFSSVALYFLGVLPFSNLNWGIILNQAYENNALISPNFFYWLAIPLVTIIVLSIGLILIAQSLDRVFNPRVRTRHAKQDEDLETSTSPRSEVKNPSD